MGGKNEKDNFFKNINTLVEGSWSQTRKANFI